MSDHIVTTFVQKGETVVAAIDLDYDGLHPVGALHVGYYPADGGGGELWLVQEGRRIQFPASALPAIIKQLRRAAQEGATNEQ